MSETTTHNVYDLETATDRLTNLATRLVDKRETRADLPDALFERVARAVSGALIAEIHEDGITFTVHDADPSVDNAEVYVEVEMVMKETANNMDYLANKYSQVAFMGASVRDAPDGWMRVTYRFYTPTGDEAFPGEEDHYLPPLK